MASNLPEFLIYFLMLLAGCAAGIINTLAGSGSVFTLSIMLFAGLPEPVANATNRVGILLQSIVALKGFKQNKQLDVKSSKLPLIAVLMGAMVGAYFAVDIDKELLEKIIGAVMVFLLILIVTKLKPQISQEETKEQPLSKQVLQFILMFVSGFYGGFIQAGVGVLLLVAVSLSTSMNLVKANAFKLLAVLIYTIPVLAIFIWQGLVNWQYGLTLALGQSIGAYLASKFGASHPKAPIWIKRILITVIVLTIIKTLF